MRRAAWAMCAALAVAGCGGADPQSDQRPDDGTARQEASRTVEFVADKQTPLRWTRESYRTEAGRIELRVDNPSAAVHGVAVERSRRCCRQPGSDSLGYTKTIDTGETTSTVVNLPAGRYWAYCNVDGHWQGGMVSRLIVE
jgi:Sulfocyanin (SoxE) domain